MKKLSEKEITQKGRELAQALNSYYEAILNKKEIMAECKAEITKYENQIITLKEEITSGHEMEDLEPELELS